MSNPTLNLPGENVVSEEVAPGVWGRLIRALSKVHPAVRLILLVAGLTGFLLLAADSVA